MKVKHNFHLENNSKAGKEKTLSLFYNLSYGHTEVHPKTGQKKYTPVRMSTGFKMTEKDWDRKKSRPKNTYRFRHALNIRMRELVKISEELLSDFFVLNNKLPHPHVLKDSIKVKMGMLPDTQTSPLMTNKNKHLNSKS
jgi:hypothetical protein